jgi:hypothetical protein
MFAIIAVAVFGFALLLDLLNNNLGAPDLFNWNTLVLIGLLFLGLHFAGAGGRWYRGSRPGRG